MMIRRVASLRNPRHESLPAASSPPWRTPAGWIRSWPGAGTAVLGRRSIFFERIDLGIFPKSVELLDDLLERLEARDAKQRVALVHEGEQGSADQPSIERGAEAAASAPIVS